MKLRRIIFSIGITAFLVVGLYTDSRIYYAIFFVMLFMLLVSLLSMLWTLVKFNYLQILEPKEGVKGDKVKLSIQIYNDFILPFPHIKIYYDTLESYLTDEIKSATMSVMPRQMASVDEMIDCRYRGDYTIGMKYAEISDVFGLLSIKLDFSKISYFKTINLFIKPRIIETPYLPLPKRIVEGRAMHVQRSNDRSANMSDLREYQIQDNIKRIHWKVSARLNKLMIKNYEQTSLPDTTLYLDCANHEIEGIAGVELEDSILECATAVVHHTMTRWMPLRLVTWSSSRIEMYGNNPGDFATIYEYLSKVDFEGLYQMKDILLGELKSVNYTGCLFLISWRLSMDTFDILMVLKKSGIDITVILITVQDIDLKIDLIISNRMISQMKEIGINVIMMYYDDNFDDVLEAGL